MKKIPFYNPSSPLFFHIAVLLLYILTFLPSLAFYGFFSAAVSILLFSALYPFFALVMAILVRKAYINTYQISVPEEFANKLILYNHYLIYVIYVLSTILVFIEVETIPPDVDIGPLPYHFIFLFFSWLCFLFYY